MTSGQTVQIKICGLTTPDQARAVADLGADAIGLIFYPKSPRNVSIETARRITDALPAHVARVGVFVDQEVSEIIETAQAAGLTTVQLHGRFEPEAIRRVTAAGFGVVPLIKTTDPDFSSLPHHSPEHGVLVECGKGVLPGGNGAVWNWGDARELAGHVGFAIAGGLSPGNVAEAIRAAMPDAVDVSSGVEASPGIKNPGQVRAFIEAAKTVCLNRIPKKVFI